MAVGTWRFLNRPIRWLAIVAIAASAGLLAQAQAPPQQSTPDPDTSQPPIFRSGVTLVTTDVIVRDENGQFIADLEPEDFVVFENDVQQEVSSLVLVHGGRVFDVLVPDQQPVQEGLVLPSRRAVDNTAGRIFILFVDDLHLDPALTPKVRQIFETIGDELVHEGDLFGIIATGTSPLSTELSYDRSLLYAAADRITGGGFKPDQLVMSQQNGGSGLGEIRWRAHVAFKTAREVLSNLERITNRRKVFIYISAGYDFNPFGDLFGNPEATRELLGDFAAPYDDPFDQVSRQGAVFSDGELHMELAELARVANRANTTFHTLDPRGLMAGSDVQYNIPMQELNTHIHKTQTSLRTIAELTGGIAIVNRNNFVSGLRDIDAETSDYYILGFNTTAPEANDERTRRLRVEVAREGADVRSREAYTFERVAAR